MPNIAQPESISANNYESNNDEPNLKKDFVSQSSKPKLSVSSGEERARNETPNSAQENLVGPATFSPHSLEMVCNSITNLRSKSAVSNSPSASALPANAVSAMSSNSAFLESQPPSFNRSPKMKYHPFSPITLVPSIKLDDDETPRPNYLQSQSASSPFGLASNKPNSSISSSSAPLSSISSTAAIPEFKSIRRVCEVTPSKTGNPDLKGDARPCIDADNAVPPKSIHILPRKTQHDTQCKKEQQSLNYDQKQPPQPLRRGKWTPEEEKYALAVIRSFNAGHLDAAPGTTLRAYLSEKLKCDPMRITKKFTGDASIGKRVFHPVVRCENTIKEIENAQEELQSLYQRWKLRLESQKQESARKAMAAVAVSVATSSCPRPHIGQLSAASPTSSSSISLLRYNNGGMRVPSEMIELKGLPIQQKVVRRAAARTAVWLDKATKILSKNTHKNYSKFSHEKYSDRAQDTDSTHQSSNEITELKHPITSNSKPNKTSNSLTPANSTNENEACIIYEDSSSFFCLKNKIENEMKEILQLIQEGMVIQATASGLPKLIADQHNIDICPMRTKHPKTKGTNVPEGQKSSSELGSASRVCSVPKAFQTQGLKLEIPGYSSTHNSRLSTKRKFPSGENTSTQPQKDFLLDSPDNPMTILASLSSHAAPVPIDDSAGNRENSVSHSLSSGPFVSTSSLANKHYKVTRMPSSNLESLYSADTLGTSDAPDVGNSVKHGFGPSSTKTASSQSSMKMTSTEAEDAKALVSFLHNSVRIEERNNEHRQ